MTKHITDLYQLTESDAHRFAAYCTASNMGCEHVLQGNGRTPKPGTPYEILMDLWRLHADAMPEDMAIEGIIEEFNSWLETWDTDPDWSKKTLAEKEVAK